MSTKETATEVTTEATAAPAPAPAPAAPSKMERAKVLYSGLKDGSIPTAEGKSNRATFISTMQEPEYGMTASGAATYWQNLVSLERTGKLYPHTAAKKKKAATEEPAGDADAQDAQNAEDDSTADAPAEEAADAKAEDDLSHLEG